jgi:subfamily B ATP-binding cassette protein MsbA
MTQELTPLSLMQRMRRCWVHFKTPYSAWIAAVVGMLVVSLSEPLVPALLKPLLDQGFVAQGLQIWMVPVALIGIFAVRGVGSFVAQISLSKVASLGVLKLRQQLFEKLQFARPALFQNENASSVINTTVHETQGGAGVMVNTLLTLGRDTLTLFTLLCYLIYLNWQLILVVLVLFPFLFWGVRGATQRLNRLNKESLNAADELAYTLEENVLAYREIRLQGAQQEQIKRFVGQAESIMRLIMKALTSSALITPMTQILSAVALSAVISIALLQSSLQGTTVGGFASFVTGMLMLIAPIKHLSEVAGPLTRSLTSLERGFEFLHRYPDETGGSHRPARVSGQIDFDQVTLSYAGQAKPAIDHLSLSIMPGQTVALVGASGSGKTSLVNLLPRWIDAQSGQVKLDGVEVKDFDLQALRRQMGMVSQHVVILNDTVLNNICLGQDKDRNRAMQCLIDANLGDWLAQQPLGLDAVVGHNASQLSGGQRQRLAIARAMYKDAPILILDEATSALDNESEKLVQDALTRLSQGRTTLIIAHRLSTIEHADKIVVMESGQVAETGAHADLMQRQGAYWNYVMLGERAKS